MLKALQEEDQNIIYLLFGRSKKLRVGMARFEVINTLRVYLRNYILYGYRFYSAEILNKEYCKDIVRNCFHVMRCVGHIFLPELLNVTDGIYPNFGVKR
jgi:hypothetical protein